MGAAIQWRRHGRTGFAAHAGVNAAERIANALYVVWVLADVVDAIVRLVLGGSAHALTAPGVAGVACAAAALLIGTIARLSMGAAWRTSADSADGTLVSTGFFRLVRNPVYVAMVVLALGVALLIPDVATIPALIAAVVGLEIQVRAVEEPHLRATYGDAFDRYAARTGRFVPLLGRLR